VVEVMIRQRQGRGLRVHSGTERPPPHLSAMWLRSRGALAASLPPSDLNRPLRANDTQALVIIIAMYVVPSPPPHLRLDHLDGVIEVGGGRLALGLEVVVGLVA
jgi:hypothetical protein